MKNKTNRVLGALAAACVAGSLLSCGSDIPVEGTWLEPVPGMNDRLQGFTLQENGKASSVNMATLRYETWKRNRDLLVLSGKSLGNHQTIPFSDTLVIEKLTQDSLVLKKKSLTLRFARGTAEQAAASTTQAPARSFTAKGTVTLAHETRSFTPAGDTTAYWLVDKTGVLTQQYDSLTNGIKNGTLVYAELEVVDMGKSSEGFAKTYASVYQVLKVNKITLQQQK